MKYSGLLLAIIMVAVGANAADAIEAVPFEKEAPQTIVSLAQTAEIAYATQEQFWELLPPSGNDFLYIHPDSVVRPVNWKSKDWPKIFLSQMMAEMQTVNSSMYAFYRLTVIETRDGELLWYNGGRLIWQTAAPLDYNEYLFAFQHWNVDSIEALGTQRAPVGAQLERGRGDPAASGSAHEILRRGRCA